MSDEYKTDGGPLTEQEREMTQGALEVISAFMADQLPPGHRVGGVRAMLGETPVVVVVVDQPDNPENPQSGVMIPIMIVATPGLMAHVTPPSGVITEDGAF